MFPAAVLALSVALTALALAMLAKERSLGQRFVVDATLYCDLSSAGRSDDINETVDYSKVYKYGALNRCRDLPMFMFVSF